MNKILIFTGSRGEWGYLRPLLDELEQRDVTFEIAATNMHVDPKYGATETEILADGFEVKYRVPMSISFKSQFQWGHSLGYLAGQVPNIIEQSKPDIILLAGDRAETAVIATICYYFNILICHIQAGELSGHKDGLARHAIGKFAHIHFASNRDAAQRLSRLGEEDFRIYQTGAPQLDDLLDDDYIQSGSNVLTRLRLDEEKKTVIVIYHGNSDELQPVEQYVSQTHEVLNRLGVQQIWVLPNSDAESHEVEKAVLSLPRTNTLITRSLPRAEFAYLLKHSVAIVGNSSVGILEAPAVGLPSVNIGTRQEGRYESQSVFQMKNFNKSDLESRISIHLNDPQRRQQYFEYGEGDSAIIIAKILCELDASDPKLLNKKLVEPNATI